MRHSTAQILTVLACVALAIVATSLITDRADAGAHALAGPIATIDLQRVIENNDEFREKDERRTARGKNLEIQLQELVDQINSAQAQLALIPEDDAPARREQQAEKLRLEAKLEADRRVLSSLLNFELGDILREFHAKLTDATAKIAKAEGYQIVLSDDRIPTLPVADADRLQGIIGAQRLLFVDGAVDITDAVINRLNAEYAAGR